MQVLLNVGQSGSQQPATANDAAQYKSSHNYSDDMLVVADPNWQKISQAVHHPTDSQGMLGLPHFIVLDSEMKIQYSGGGGNTMAFSDITGLMASLSGVPFNPSGDCGGSAGGAASCAEGTCGTYVPANACQCDDQCPQYGDCCPDACDVCGVCP